MPHAAEAPTQLAVKSEPPAPTPVPAATDDQTVAIELPEAGEVSPVAGPPSDGSLPPLVALLVTCAADREDLIKDQALPPRFAVVERKGRAVARFHGAEHAVKLGHVLSPWHAVVRIEDGKLMTEVG